ncbi:MAG: hypothetical protein MJ179_09330 [Treponema sp.]|nr:hypothetical protein [Treponema sp.]
MKFKKVFILLLIPFLITCKYDVDAKNPNLLRQNIWDERNIPDNRNCGVEPGINLTVVTDTVEVAPGVNIFYRTDTKQFNISNSSKLPEVLQVSNYDFSQHDMVTLGMGDYTGERFVIFQNCKFKGFRNDALSPKSKGKVYFYFINCSFVGSVRTSYIRLYNCKIGGFTGDAMNPLREFYANNLYVYDLFTQAAAGEVHIDGLQIYGDSRSRNNVVNGKWVTKVETGDIHLKNVRFEIPAVNLGPDCNVGGNSCIFFAPEFSDVSDVSFENIYMNGAGQWFPLRITGGKNNEKSADGISWVHENIFVSNVMVSNNYGKIINDDPIPQARISNLQHHDNIFVTSVWKDSSGKVHLIVSNDTPVEKTLTVKSDAGTVKFKIPRCPSVSVLLDDPRGRLDPNEATVDPNGKPYKEYGFSDLPFNIEKTISGNPSFIVCFQDEEQIRYVSFDEKKHYRSEIKE